MPKTTLEQLDALQALDQAATPGPWDHVPTLYEISSQTTDFPSYRSTRDANESLVPASRNALPALIADARAYHALLARIDGRIETRVRPLLQPYPACRACAELEAIR